MMAIDSQDPTKLTMVGQPVAIPGEFPNTVAASAKNNLACVGTTGAKSGISCASFSAAGLGQMDMLRPFDLGQTTPPVGPTNSVSQTFFSADESQLFTTVKGDPMANKTGFLSVFPVSQVAGSNGNAVKSLAAQDVRTSPPGTAVLFGATTIPGTSKVFSTDASFGAAVLSMGSGANPPTVIASQAIAGQKATCWVTISNSTGSAFVTDVGTNRIVEMSVENAMILSNTDLSANGDPGLIDLKAVGDFVYALSPGNGTTPAAVTVMDVSGGQGRPMVAQHFVLSSLGVGKTAQGMAAVL